MDNTVAVILGGGHGKRLFPLTKLRSKPAVPLAGKYRLIDIPISNCINSDIRRIYVLTMFQSASLSSHLSVTYRFDSFTNGFVEVLAPEQTITGSRWFQGTADAVRQTMVHILDSPSQHILILSGDHLYRMQYQEFLDSHRESGAAISVAVKPVGRDVAPQLGILKTDAAGRIVKFVEKPSSEEALAEMASDTRQFGLSPGEAAQKPYLASMGIYIFDTTVLADILQDLPEANDFGKEVLPHVISVLNVSAFAFNGYWADIGTVRSFYEANLDLIKPVPRFSLFDMEMPIYTNSRFLPAAKVNRAVIEHSLVCEGCIIEQATLRNSILGVRTHVMQGTCIEESLIMGADYYPEEIALSGLSSPAPGIGEGTYIRRAIVDKNVMIGRNVRLVNEKGVASYDDPNGHLYVRDGIIVVAKEATIPDNFVF